MLLRQLFENYHTLDNQKILMFYKGAVSQETMVDLGSFLRSSLCGSKKIRNIFSVFIEMSHNIRHHSLERDQNQVGVGLFMIQQTPEFYTLSSGNPVPKERVAEIREKLEHLRSLDKEGLRKLYKERRRSGEDRTTKGAGLGLIEMAKKSDHPLDFEFFDCDPQTTLFRLTVKVSKGE
ncbi:MAG: SiaB family protein kinase [Acidobacteriota bacterium]|nr:SiaB family protein kinase [Acidobacteriota bacterium]